MHNKINKIIVSYKLINVKILKIMCLRILKHKLIFENN